MRTSRLILPLDPLSVNHRWEVGATESIRRDHVDATSGGWLVRLGDTCDGDNLTITESYLVTDLNFFLSCCVYQFHCCLVLVLVTERLDAGSLAQFENLFEAGVGAVVEVRNVHVTVFFFDYLLNPSAGCRKFRASAQLWLGLVVIDEVDSPTQTSRDGVNARAAIITLRAEHATLRPAFRMTLEQFENSLGFRFDFY